MAQNALTAALDKLHSHDGFEYEQQVQNILISLRIWINDPQVHVSHFHKDRLKKETFNER